MLVLAAIQCAFMFNVVAYHARVTSTGVQAGSIWLIMLLCLYFVDFYDPEVTVHRTKSMVRLLQAIGLSTIIAASIPQSWMPVLREPTPVLAGMLMVGVFLTMSRCLFADVVRHSAFVDTAIVWGTGALAASIIYELKRRPDIGVRVLGVVDNRYTGETFSGVRYLGAPDIIWSLGVSGKIRRIIIALDERRGSLPVEKLMNIKAAGLGVEDGAEVYEELTGKVWLGTFSATRLLFSRKLRPSILRLFVKRLLSIVFAILSILLTLPVMLITAVLIRLDSTGPAILRQTRVGENGRLFTLYKFRSMNVNSVGSAPATINDPRCTRVGKWIRRLRIDELPQLFNILRGDMYFVGPRPFVPDQEASLLQEIPYYRQRWVVRPGATGWAQVHRDYCSSVEDNAEKLSYDLFYIKNISIGLDFLTLLITAKILLLGRGGR